MENKPQNTPAAGVYLFPVTMSDGPVTDVLPARNLELLLEMRYFVVENIRTARRFLKKVSRTVDIDSLQFTELSEHTPEDEIPAMLRPVEQGLPLAVMSEAGCPAVADPGARLVAAAQRRGLRVIPLVGPSSILLALMGSGMNGQNFTFNGYLPIDDRARDNRLRSLAEAVTRHDTTQLFIETPYRNNRLMSRMLAVLPPDIKLCVATDITGPAESIVTHTVAQWRKINYNLDKIPTIFLLGN